MKAKFSIGELLGVGFTIIILGIGVAYGLEVMGDIASDMAECHSGYTWNATAGTCGKTGGVLNDSAISNVETNATIDAMQGVAKIPEKIPMIVTVVIASTIIGILLTYLWGRIAGRM